MPQVNSTFTKQLIKKVDALAKKRECSRSEMIERLSILGLAVVNGEYVASANTQMANALNNQ